MSCLAYEDNIAMLQFNKLAGPPFLCDVARLELPLVPCQTVYGYYRWNHHDDAVPNLCALARALYVCSVISRMILQGQVFNVSHPYQAR